ncbi:MAG TPA: PPOX class F420-dependent oxidoreductase [Candidatus Acidoferrum sp.]|jgi:PPOX class probable F420-dependent enzyme|nr:PPOX class F420-dependent oxidoreductase [Candidatus Acidoferrum sp.]
MGFAAFRDQKYLSLETFKKSGEGVKTPVWFAADPARDLAGNEAQLYIYTIGNTGKVKRIRNNGRAKIAPCTMKGVPRGEWVDASLEIITGDESARAMKLLNKKYFPWKQLLGFFALFSRRERIVMVIRPA